MFRERHRAGFLQQNDRQRRLAVVDVGK